MKNLLSYFFCTLFFFIFFIGCSKDTIYEEFELPRSQILSTEKISDSEFKIKIYVNKGVGASFEEQYLILENITDPEKTFVQEFQFANNEKECEIDIVVKLAKKQDYKIQSILRSKKNEYRSDLMYLYLSENNQSNGFIDAEFPDLGSFYKDISNNIGYTSNLNDGVHLHLNYKWIPEKPVAVKIKVDGKILLEDSITFDYWVFDNIYTMYFVSVYVEFKDINIGEHSVHVFLDEKEYILREKVRILEGNVNYSNFIAAPKNWETKYPGINMVYFYSGKLFYFLTNERAEGEIFYDIISYDLEDKNWRQNASIAFTEERCTLSGSNIQVGDDLYTLVWRDSVYHIEGEIWPKSIKVIDIWKYNISNHSFVRETKYPGEAIYEPLFLSDNHNLYIGGGHTYGFNVEGKSDFWCYNLNTKEWTPKNDTPISFNTYLSTSNLLIDNTIYIYTSYRELWKYIPLSDNWEKVSTMNGGSYYRDKSSLLYLDGNLYVVGGATSPSGIAPNNSYSEDVWKYDIQTNTWTLKTFFTPGYYQYPAFVFDNKIFATNHDVFGNFKFVEIQ